MSRVQLMNKAEMIISQKILEAKRVEQQKEIWNSLTHLEHDIEKVATSDYENDQRRDELVDNIYWHLGAIRGALK